MSHGPLPPGASCRSWDCRICGQPEPSDCSHAWGPPALDRDSLGQKCSLCGVYEIPWLRWRMGDLQRSLRAAEERAERAEALVEGLNAEIAGYFADAQKRAAERDALRARCEAAERVCEAARPFADAVEFADSELAAHPYKVHDVPGLRHVELHAELAAYDRAKEGAGK